MVKNGRIASWLKVVWLEFYLDLTINSLRNEGCLDTFETGFTGNHKRCMLIGLSWTPAWTTPIGYGFSFETNTNLGHSTLMIKATERPTDESSFLFTHFLWEVVWPHFFLDHFAKISDLYNFIFPLLLLATPVCNILLFKHLIVVIVPEVNSCTINRSNSDSHDKGVSYEGPHPVFLVSFHQCISSHIALVSVLFLQAAYGIFNNRHEVNFDAFFDIPWWEKGFQVAVKSLLIHLFLFFTHFDTLSQNFFITSDTVE